MFVGLRMYIIVHEYMCNMFYAYRRLLMFITYVSLSYIWAQNCSSVCRSTVIYHNNVCFEFYLYFYSPNPIAQVVRAALVSFYSRSRFRFHFDFIAPYILLYTYYYNIYSLFVRLQVRIIYVA